MSEYVRLRLVPVSLREARRFVLEHHRHNDPPHVHRASVGIEDEEGKLRGVGILGNPKSFTTAKDKRAAEIVRVATDGVPNGCSMLYGALTRVAWGLGYDRVFTYTLKEESGASLRASGWHLDGETGANDWVRLNQKTRTPTTAQRPTLFFEPKVPDGPKLRWIVERRQRMRAAA